VKQLAARIGVSLDEEFTLHADASVGTLETPFPCPTTAVHCLTNYLDINGAVSKTLLRRLSQLAKDDGERAKLLQVLGAACCSRRCVVTPLQLSAKHQSGTADLYEKEVCCHEDAFRARSHVEVQVQQERLNIVDILNMFKSVVITAAQLFELLPRLQVRYYSIASSDKTHPTTVAIVAVVDKDTMPSGKVLWRGGCADGLRAPLPLPVCLCVMPGQVFEGVCTTYLQQVHPVRHSLYNCNILFSWRSAVPWTCSCACLSSSCRSSSIVPSS
jgi:sulfite reductase alpha subunit-like flavoprotein